MSDLPSDVVDEAERLTRLARAAVDDGERAAYREDRATLLSERGYAARVRGEDDGDVLVLHPEEWLDDGTVRMERVEDTDRAVEVPLEGPGDPDDWSAVDDHNRDVVRRVREEHGEVHGENARAFAEFMSNHYARRVESATAAEIEEFRAEYFPRNAWPSDEQCDVIARSLELVFDVTETECPV